MAVLVPAVYERCGETMRAAVGDQGRDVAEAEADAAIGAAVRRRAVQEMRVVQRELAGPHRERLDALRVDGHLDLLSVRQEIGGGAVHRVRQLAQAMAARQRRDASCLFG